MNTKSLVGAVCAIAITSLAASSALADGKAAYEEHCKSCHGLDGKGQTKMGQKSGCKDYSVAKTWADLKTETAIKSVKEGLKDGDKTLMKPYGEKLSDAEIAAVIDYMKTLAK